MRTFRKIMVLLLALAWVPLTSHCRLETFLDLGFLNCESRALPVPEDPGHGDDGDCSIVEGAQYLSQREQVLTADGFLAIATFFSISLPRDISPAGGTFDPASSPELAPCWRFLLRAALPPRAPSVAS